MSAPPKHVVQTLGTCGCKQPRSAQSNTVLPTQARGHTLQLRTLSVTYCLQHAKPGAVPWMTMCRYVCSRALSKSR